MVSFFLISLLPIKIHFVSEYLRSALCVMSKMGEVSSKPNGDGHSSPKYSPTSPSYSPTSPCSQLPDCPCGLCAMEAKHAKPTEKKSTTPKRKTPTGKTPTKSKPETPSKRRKTSVSNERPKIIEITLGPAPLKYQSTSFANMTFGISTVDGRVWKGFSAIFGTEIEFPSSIRVKNVAASLKMADQITALVHAGNTARAFSYLGDLILAFGAAPETDYKMVEEQQTGGDRNDVSQMDTKTETEDAERGAERTFGDSADTKEDKEVQDILQVTTSLPPAPVPQGVPPIVVPLTQREVATKDAIIRHALQNAYTMSESARESFIDELGAREAWGDYMRTVKRKAFCDFVFKGFTNRFTQ